MVRAPIMAPRFDSGPLSAPSSPEDDVAGIRVACEHADPAEGAHHRSPTGSSSPKRGRRLSISRYTALERRAGDPGRTRGRLPDARSLPWPAAADRLYAKGGGHQIVDIPGRVLTDA